MEMIGLKGALTSILSIALGFLPLFGQEVIATSGGSFQSGGIQIDWTIGEFMVETIENNTNQITQGFHQPYFTLSNVDELDPEVGDIQVFPNPASDWINLSLTMTQNQTVDLQLLDMEGKTLINKQFINQNIEDRIDASTLSNGTYLMVFTIEENHYTRLINIQKN